MIKILLREYDVDKGAIYLNGHDIRDYRLTDLRSLMGYVPQDQFLFATSVLDNIRFGNPNLPLSAVEEATKLAQVYQDIVAMPQGFDTLIGEKGVSLSGGQKQRLAMSRAMMPRQSMPSSTISRRRERTRQPLSQLIVSVQLSMQI